MWSSMECGQSLPPDRQGKTQHRKPANTPVLLHLLHPMPGLRQDVKQGSRQQHPSTEAEQHGVNKGLASLHLFSLETKNCPFMKWICLVTLGWSWTVTYLNILAFIPIMKEQSPKMIIVTNLVIMSSITTVSEWVTYYLAQVFSIWSNNSNGNVWKFLLH